MFVEEHTAKGFLAGPGWRLPRGWLARTPAEAAHLAEQVARPVVLKVQIPAGRRGKAGGIRFATTPEHARLAAAELLGATIGGYQVGAVLIEEQIPFVQELYVAVARDTRRRCPIVLFSNAGGVDVEEVHRASPGTVRVLPVDVRRGVDESQARGFLTSAGCERGLTDALATIVTRLYQLYWELDAELLEINPLAVTPSGEMVPLDCKLLIDDSALGRHPELPSARVSGTRLELRARAEGLLYVELHGNVGVLANGAGLTMATMDAIRTYGGQPANFMEIGGDAYRRAASALSIVLAKPGVRSLLVNLCGAYARTDVMTEGIVGAWKTLRPAVPVAFSIHGTGEEEAQQMVRDHLGMEPYNEMDEAVKAAVSQAR